MVQDGDKVSKAIIDAVQASWTRLIPLLALFSSLKGLRQAFTDRVGIVTFIDETVDSEMAAAGLSDKQNTAGLLKDAAIASIFLISLPIPELENQV